MNQLYALFTRALFAVALTLFACAICAAQSPSNAVQQTGAEKSAANDKDKSAAAANLEEELAKTPAGKTVAKFFTAFNSGDIKTMRAFHESYGGDVENADKDMEFYDQSGGLKLHSLTSSAKDKIGVLAQTKKDGRWIKFEFTLGASEPYAIEGIQVRPASAPPAQVSN